MQQKKGGEKILRKIATETENQNTCKTQKLLEL